METKLSNKLFFETPYQMVAREFGVSAKFVGMVARGERKAVRGKGLEIKKRLEQMVAAL